MKIKTDIKTLKNEILKPINRISEDCILHINDDRIYSISSIDSGSNIIYINKKIKTDIDQELVLNIKNVNKLISVLNCIPDQEPIEMSIESNHIKYQSSDFKFKYHLTEDGVIIKTKIKKEKLDNIEYQTSVNIDIKAFQSILKSSSFLNSDSVKLYFYTKSTDDEKSLYCDITNKKIENSDLITIKLSDHFEGEHMPKELICDVEHIRKFLITPKYDLKIKFNTKIGYTIFEIIDENEGFVKYILPTLTD